MNQLSKDLTPEEFLSVIDTMFSAAVITPNHPLHQGVFATSRESLIQQRYVVVRRWSLLRRTLMFHTDNRSPKISDLKQTASSSFIFYSNPDQLQLRFECITHVHTHDRLARALFNDTTPSQRLPYQTPIPPSDKTTLSELSNTTNQQDPFNNFAVCVCNFNTIELLYLNRFAHVRIIYEWNDKGELVWDYLAP
ncbi:MAG: hypothetical protein VW378_02710 [bacterium]